MVTAEEQVETLDFCISLMLIPKAHVMTENTFTNTGVHDNCTVTNTQLNVPFGLWNQVVTGHQTRCALAHPNISILNATNTFSVNTNMYVTLMPLINL
jgi:hypothetical protein